MQPGAGTAGTNRSRHIVWDWNGTVLGDSRVLIDSVISAFTATGFAAVEVEDHQRHFRRPIAEFFEKLANRPLTDGEQRSLQHHFDLAYEEHSARVTLTNDARHALSTWVRAGHTQSLLSMCPHDRLVPLVQKHGVLTFFTRVDGCAPDGPDTKAWHLKEHLRALDRIEPDDVVLVGDTVDDALAARAADIRCVVYHSGGDALQGIEHFSGMNVPIARTLSDAVAYAMQNS